jgi:hypothetical protein
MKTFTNDFSFQISAGSPTADGLTWTLQNNSTAALGTAGGELGYTGIGKSVAVKFDLYDNAGEGVDSTGLFLNGVSPYTPASDMSAAGIDLHSGHMFKVHMTYNGTALAMIVTDATTNAVFSTSWTVNIPTTVGAATAYAGFTAGTGGYVANQSILNWTMSNSATAPGTVATPTFSPAAGTYLGTQTVTLNDVTSGATIFYTLDGTQPGTAAGGSTLQYSGPLTVTSTKTIKALATASGQTTSATASATYTIQSQVAAPTFSPVAGTYSSTQTVSISTATAGATIYYTTNGTTPTSSSAVYSTPISVSASQTLKAFAVKSGFFDSTVAAATYTIGIAAPIQYEVESAAIFNASKSSGPTYRTFGWPGFTDGQGTTLDATAVGQSVAITLNIPKVGVYAVAVAAKGYPTRGIIRLSVNGASVGTAMDEYSGTEVLQRFALGTVSLPAGNVTFVFTSTGKNSASSGFTQALDYIKLTPQ